MTTPPTSTVSAKLPWDELAASLDGRLIRPGTPGYPVARLGYDPRFDDVRPRAVVMATTSRDVARTILFARDHSLPFAARCGGHSYGGYSLSDGIVIDVSEMATVRTSAGTATIGAGARVIDVATGVTATGAVIPVGTCATVGISGLTLGGGQGVVGRRFGLTCDSLRAATVVLADGRIVSCDAANEPDLFWALRGGGGGNFGVVTSFTFSSHPSRGSRRSPCRGRGRMPRTSSPPGRRGVRTLRLRSGPAVVSDGSPARARRFP